MIKHGYTKRSVNRRVIKGNSAEFNNIIQVYTFTSTANKSTLNNVHEMQSCLYINGNANADMCTTSTSTKYKIKLVGFDH